MISQEANQIHDEIWEITNFIGDESNLFLHNFAQSISEESWELLDQGRPRNDWTSNRFVFDNQQISSLITKRLESAFSNEHRFNSWNTIRRFREGNSLVEHWDAELDSNVYYGAIYYINDNFLGGELYYPNINFTHKPKANSLVIHSSSQKYKHGVKQVKSGTRYFMTEFANASTKI
jgi:hypothetical protein